MYSDPSGHIAIIAIIIGVIIGAIAGFGVATYIDYKKDEQFFNGSVS